MRQRRYVLRINVHLLVADSPNDLALLELALKSASIASRAPISGDGGDALEHLIARGALKKYPRWESLPWRMASRPAAGGADN